MLLDEPIADQKYEGLLPFVSEEKRRRVMRLRSAADKKLSLLADILVRCAVCQTHPIKNKDLVFRRTDFGKPYLTGYPSFQYNIAHTRDALVVGISQEAVGIDIEKVRPADLRIAKRFFTPHEVAWIVAEEQAVDARFYEIWTKKEAYLKWLGKGLCIPLSSFDVTDIALKEKLSSARIDEYIVSLYSGVGLQADAIEIIPERELIRMASCLL